MVKVGDRRILAVDWDERELRVVHARIRKGKVRVQEVFAVSIPQEVSVGDAVAMGQLLRRSLDQEQVTCRRVIVDIPRDQVVLNTLSLPDVSTSDMAGMVGLRLAKSLPFPASQAVIDFALPVDDADGDGHRDVVAAAVQTEVVEFYRQVCHNAGLRLERIGLRPYATREAVRAFLGAGLPERVLMVDIGPVLTEIDVLRHGQLCFSRAASVVVPPDDTAPVPMTPTQDDGPDQPDPLQEHGDLSVIPFGMRSEGGPRDITAVVADLMVEVTRSIEAYRATDPGAEMDCAVVAGSTGIEETLAEAIHRRFGINSEIYNPSAWFDGDAERGAAACGFSASLGLVLGHATEGRRHFDFLHPKKQEVPGEARLKKVPVVAAAVVLLAVAGLAFYLQGPAKQFAKRQRLEDRILEVKAEIKENRAFVRMVDAAKAFEAEQVVWLDEFRHLVTLLPSNKKIVLEKLDMYQDGPRIQISFRASDSRQGAKVIEEVESFRVEDSDNAHYAARAGPTSEKKVGEFRHQGSVSVRIVGAEQGSKGSKGRG